MSNIRDNCGMRSSGFESRNRFQNAQSSEEFMNPSLISNAASPTINANDGTRQQTFTTRSNSGVIRHGNNNQNSDEKTQYSSANNTNRRLYGKRDSTALNTTSESPAIKRPCLPPISYSTLTELKDKSSDDILAEMLDPNFQLKEFLNDKHMQESYDCIFSMIILIEKITQCIGSREHIVMILAQLPDTLYLEGVYDEVRKLDPDTNKSRFKFIELFLKISNTFLAMIPYSVDGLIKIFEHIKLQLTKNKLKSREFEDAKKVLDEVLQRVKEIEKRKQTSNTTTIQNDIGQPPNDYRKLSIVPNVREMLSEQRTYLRKNIVDGIYENAEQYLDIHFRLLREDFVGPLRDGIRQYLSKAKRENFNVRIYENVHLLGPRLIPRGGLVYDLLLDTTIASKISWANSRRLIYGSLLFLTFDNFQSCAFVTVEDRSQIERNFIISVKTLENDERFQINLDDIDRSYSLTMIETVTYFEAYRPILNALQKIPSDRFPLGPFILKLTNTMVPPDYINSTTTYDFTPLLVDLDSDIKANMINHKTLPVHSSRYQGRIRPIIEKKFQINYKQSDKVDTKYKSVVLLNKDQWPTSDELHLNPKQREALILALTNKVALIQGPPGTGKTYLGVRITEMLLHNRSVWCPTDEQSTPILMICQTNHALDQFLELIVKHLNIREGIVRVGSRCQNPTIQRFLLFNARQRARENRSLPDDIFNLRHKLLDEKTKAEQVLKLQLHNMGISRTKIISPSSFNVRFVIDHKHYLSLLAPYYDYSVEIALLAWLGLGNRFQQIPDDFIYKEDLETAVSAMEINDNIEEQQPTDRNENYEDKLNEEEEEEEQRHRQNELDLEEYEDFPSSPVRKPETIRLNRMDKEILSKDEGKRQTGRKKPDDIHRLIRDIIQIPTTLNDETVKQINADVWQLPMVQRHNLYRYWLLKYRQHLHPYIRHATQKYNQAISALDEYRQEVDYHILKDSIIVAMTTTCAAKHHKVLEKLQSKIVIVEEAAAIFEAHIITALNTNCKHLILIGDHLQLRPSPSVYHLAGKYDIDVSLFERLVKNNFPNVRLNIQRRMRPEIARLMKHFYDDLEDHISVKTDRAPVRGIDSNIFFIKHNHNEATVDDGSSKRNEFEAKYVIELAQYLIKQGYTFQQITILVMYAGQRQFIAKHAKQIGLLDGIRIMVTDNYQGEENDIIILSLVRSNSEKNIGFLKTQNRICVALSRARCGLFVIGNMSLLAEVDEMWKKIIASVSETNDIGPGLTLSCRQHSKDKFIADKPESFAQRPEGGCRKTCNAQLKCGHYCELMCHSYDFEHKKVVCPKKCYERLSCGHLCRKQCHVETPNEHGLCCDSVEKTIPECGHTIRTQCCETPTAIDCKKSSPTRLACGHIVDAPCRIISSPDELKRFPCPKPCGKMLACKHKCTGKCENCRTKRLHVACEKECGRELICSHVCEEPCAASCPPCLRECQTRCIHFQCKNRCKDLCTPCKKPCAYECKHLKCTRLCSELCNRGPCNEPCDRKLKCGHTCIGVCGELCPPQCRICDKHIVQDRFFGSVDKPDARFVFLPDCKHIIEVTALDKCVEECVNGSNDKTAIRFPECPRCRQRIHRCTRYMPIINQVRHLISQVKEKILDNKSKQEINNPRNQLITEYRKIRHNLKEINLDKSVKDLFSVLYDKNYFFSDDMLNLMTNIIAFLNEIDQILIDGREKLQRNIFEDLVNYPLRQIVKYLSTQRHNRNFAEQQLIDIQSELERIRRFIYIETLVFSLKQTLKENEQEGIDSMQNLTKKTGPFTDQDRQKFDDLVKQFEYLNNLPDLGITERERIGGQNHRLMDGSQNAAWSNEANLNLPQPPF